jgi:hypothetical protein
MAGRGWRWERGGQIAAYPPADGERSRRVDASATEDGCGLQSAWVHLLQVGNDSGIAFAGAQSQRCAQREPIAPWCFVRGRFHAFHRDFQPRRMVQARRGGNDDVGMRIGGQTVDHPPGRFCCIAELACVAQGATGAAQLDHAQGAVALCLALAIFDPQPVQQAAMRLRIEHLAAVSAQLPGLPPPVDRRKPWRSTRVARSWRCMQRRPLSGSNCETSTRSPPSTRAAVTVMPARACCSPTFDCHSHCASCSSAALVAHARVAPLTLGFGNGFSHDAVRTEPGLHAARAGRPCHVAPARTRHRVRYPLTRPRERAVAVTRHPRPVTPRARVSAPPQPPITGSSIKLASPGAW